MGLKLPCSRALVVLTIVAVSQALANASPAQNGAAAAARIASDLAFPTLPTAVADLKTEMALLVPTGTGPFPAIVMLHACAGLNTTIVKHASEAVARGFVVLMTDSFGSRGVESVCYGPRNGVNLFRGVRDALQAVDHLRSLPVVDKARVAIVGYSWGAMLGLMTASPMYRDWLGFRRSPAAIVAHYPGCFTITTQTGRSFEVFSRDADVPTLSLLGGDDTETPPEECERKFKAANYPEMLQWHTYPGATHCWDCRRIDGLQKIDVRGNRVSYRFDAAVTHDASERTFEFLNRN